MEGIVGRPDDVIQNNSSIAETLPYSNYAVILCVIIAIAVGVIALALLLVTIAGAADGTVSTLEIVIYLPVALLLAVLSYQFFFSPTAQNYSYLDARQNIWEQLNDQGFKNIDLQGRVLYAERDGKDLTCYFADLGEGTDWKVMCDAE